MTQPRQVSHRLFTFDFATACVTVLLVFTSSYLVVPILPLYVLHLGGKESDIGLITASFALATLVARFLAGKWSERSGPARVMRAAAAVILLSAVAYNFAGVIWLLVLTRILHGVGVGAYSTSSNSLVAYMAPIARRGQAMGLLLLFVSVSMGIGPMIGVALVNASGFSTLFIIMIGVTFVPFVTIRMVSSLGRYGPKEKTEGKFVNWDAILPAFVGATTYFTYGALASYLPVHALQRGLDNPGLYFAAYSAGAIVIRLFGAGLVDRYGRVAVIVPAALSLSLSTAWLAVAVGPWSIIGAGWVYGLGTGVLFPALMAYSVDMVGPQERSSGVATFLASSDLGNILGAVVSSIVVSQLSLQAVWVVAGGVAFVGLGIFVAVGRQMKMPSQTG